MNKVRRVSILDQTAEHLREGLRTGRWRGELPGVLRLAEECAVSKGAIRGALKLLEKEGWVTAGHSGGRRTALAMGGGTLAGEVRAKSRTLRIMILPNVPLAEENTALNHLLRDIQRSLVASGHTVEVAAKTQTDLGFAPSRLGRFLAATPADGWIVPAAPRSVLEFFAAQPIPVMAIGGRSLGLEIASAGVDGTPALCAATRRLVELGHRRIVLICGRGWRQPAGGRSILAYTAELARHGIQGGDYHMPDFEPTPAGLHALCTSLFRITPPTALIVESADYTIATLSFLAQRGLTVPRDVSLVCLYPDAPLEWCYPPIARLRHDDKVISRRVIRWCRALARGHVDRESVLFPSEFDEGGTIGPVR